MPEHEFELYLSLLSRFLRLQPAQRDEIADELRDHLEERLEALAARGLSREEAIRTALDEFGDAAELAQHFTYAAHIRQRRLIMRVTFGTVAALAATLLVATAFWPESPQAPAPRLAVAQAQSKAPAPASAAKKPAAEASFTAEDEEKTAVETKLSKRIGKLDFEDTPLNEALEFLSEAIDVDILFINRQALTENGVQTDGPVNLQIKRANLTARVALDLVLEPLKLSYTIRDGLIMVTTAAEANQIQVYNVRDLLPNLMLPQTTGMPGMGTGPGTLSGMAASGRVAILRFAQAGPAAGGIGGGGFIGPGGGMAAPGGMPPGMGGAGAMGGGGPAVVRESNSLAEVIAMTIDPASWDGDGGNGSIVQYQELLVVKNSQTVHGKIKALLEMMRTSARNPPAGGAGPAVGGLPIVPPAGGSVPGTPAGVPGATPAVPTFKPAAPAGR